MLPVPLKSCSNSLPGIVVETCKGPPCIALAPVEYAISNLPKTNSSVVLSNLIIFLNDLALPFPNCADAFASIPVVPTEPSSVIVGALLYP